MHALYVRLMCMNVFFTSDKMYDLFLCFLCFFCFFFTSNKGVDDAVGRFEIAEHPYNPEDFDQPYHLQLRNA